MVSTQIDMLRHFSGEAISFRRTHSHSKSICYRSNSINILMRINFHFACIFYGNFTARKRPRDIMNDFFALKFTLAKSKSNITVSKSKGAMLASYSSSKSFCNRCMSVKFSLIGESLFPLTSLSQS